MKKPSMTTIGIIVGIVCSIGSAIGTALMTIGTSEKVLGGYIEETEAELKKLEEEES